MPKASKAPGFEVRSCQHSFSTGPFAKALVMCPHDILQSYLLDLRELVNLMLRMFLTLIVILICEHRIRNLSRCTEGCRTHSDLIHFMESSSVKQCVNRLFVLVARLVINW